MGDGGYGGGSRSENYSDRDVYALRNFLIKEGVADFIQEEGTAGSSMKNSFFNETVQRAVIKFQTKYGIEQTGFVGPLTRGQLNKLYGCNNNKPVMCSADMRQCPNGMTVSRSGPNCEFICLDTAINKVPVISSISGPTTLKIGEQGTWIINAYSPGGNQLTYYVNWDQYDTAAGTTAELKSPVIQTSTFTHAYDFVSGDSRIFNPKFVVRDSQGRESVSTISVKVYKDNLSEIKVISPGNEYWTAGTDKQINWSGGNEYNNVSIKLGYEYCDAYATVCPTVAIVGPDIILENSVKNTGSYGWIVATDVNNKSILPGNYHVVICGVGPVSEGSPRCGVSKTFTIK